MNLSHIVTSRPARRSRLRLLSPLAAALLLVGTAACDGDDRTAPAQDVAVKMTLQAQASVPAGSGTVQVHVSYARSSGQLVPLDVTPSTLPLGAAGATANVDVAARPCFADAAREAAPTGQCVLHVELVLRDADGVTVSSVARDVGVHTPDAVVGGVVLELVAPVLSVSGEPVAWSAPRGSTLPAAITLPVSAGAGVAVGELTATIVDAAGAAWLGATVAPEGAAVTLRPTTTDLAPGSYTATVRIASSRTVLVPVDVPVSFVVEPPLQRLVVRATGDGTARVRSVPAGIDCDLAAGSAIGACDAAFAAGSIVRLLIDAAAGSVVEDVRGACSTESCTVRMDGEREVVVRAAVAGRGEIAGQVRDAVTGDAVGGATVTLHAGGTTAGAPVATTVADAQGRYRFQRVAGGSFSVAAVAAGYSRSQRTGIAVADAVVEAQDVVLSPTLGAGEWRIVLNWGASPSDLDSHLYGPASAGGYHLYYGNSSVHPWASLDRDDTDGHGPETVTILQQPAGVHRFVVHNYSGGATALAASGATVQLYDASGLVTQFAVPTGQSGLSWTVFELNGTTVTPINRIDGAPSLTAGPTASRRAGVRAPGSAGKR